MIFRFFGRNGATKKRDESGDNGIVFFFRLGNDGGCFFFQLSFQTERSNRCIVYSIHLELKTTLVLIGQGPSFWKPKAKDSPWMRWIRSGILPLFGPTKTPPGNNQPGRSDDKREDDCPTLPLSHFPYSFSHNHGSVENGELFER